MVGVFWPPNAGTIIQPVTEAFSQPYEEILERESLAYIELSQEPGIEEGVKAFLEKREPDFHSAAMRGKTDDA